MKKGSLYYPIDGFIISILHIVCGHKIVFAALLLFPIHPALAEQMNLDLQQKNGMNTAVTDDTSATGESGTKWDNKINFFIELENYMNTYTEQEFKDIFKKNELRFNLTSKVGTYTTYFQIDMNAYMNFHVFSDLVNPNYAYSDSALSYGRNLRLSGDSYEINFQNLFLNLEIKEFRFRAGNQIFNWGTTDVFNPTSSFNPNDLREFLFKDDDEAKQGIPAFSTLIMFGGDSVEFVVAPVHVPIIIPEPGNFWGMHYRQGPFPVTIEDPQELPVTLENIAVGCRFAKNISGVDMYFSYFHGPDIEPHMRPIATKLIPNHPISIAVRPESYIIDKFGFALNKAIDTFTIQTEIAYSPNKTGVIDQKTTTSVKLPFDIERGHHISYSAGLNWFIPLDDWIPKHQGDSLITAEWFQSVYINQKIIKPILTDILILQARDTLLNSRFTISFTAMVNVIDVGYILTPMLEYTFDIGLALNASYSHISSNSNDLLTSYKNNDIFTIRIRYEY